jgi:hypothetical protein
MLGPATLPNNLIQSAFSKPPYSAMSYSKERTMKLIQLLLAAACAIGTAYADQWKDESGKGKDRGYSSEKGWKGKEHQKEWKDGHGSYFYDHGYTRLDIPPGHYPPPGECRIWYPDRPPGHQPPPGKCGAVPPGAWLIRHPHEVPGHVYVTVYESQRPGTVLVVGEFEIASGAFLRVIAGY